MPNLDQFFTNDDVAENCIQMLNLDEYDLAVEPSAGSGSFYNKIGIKKIGVDLDPKVDGIIKQDYLNFKPPTSDKVLVIGNPPFGKNSSLAIKFFNHSCYADTIAFIVPKTFRKPSVINRLNKNYTLREEVSLPLDSFHTPDGKSYPVPCVWQVWDKLKDNGKRPKVETVKSHQDFKFVDNIAAADFMIQRVGAGAGATHKNFHKSKSSHYLLKASDEVYQKMKDILWDYKDSPKFDTAGNPSISKHDLITKYMKTYHCENQFV